jgi:hypothetical protein
VSRSAGSRSIRLPAPSLKGAAKVDRPRIGLASASPFAMNDHGQETSASRSIQAARQDLGSSPLCSRSRSSGSEEPDASPKAVARRVRGAAHRATAVTEGGAAKASHVAEGEERRRQGAWQREEPHAEADPIPGRIGHAAHTAGAQSREAFPAAPAAQQAQRARLGHRAQPGDSGVLPSKRRKCRREGCCAWRADTFLDTRPGLTRCN